MRERTERYVYEIGVRLPGGEVHLRSTVHAAQDHARRVNEGLRAAGMSERAEVVKRTAHVVTTTAAEPWQKANA